MGSPWDDDLVKPVIELLARRWVLAVLAELRRRPLRRVELRRRLSGVSEKSLTETLRELEQRGVVARQSFNEIPPRVEYELTAGGQSLVDLLVHLTGWLDGTHELD